MTKKKTIEIGPALKYFFQLPDWKMRTVWVGGVPLLVITLIFLEAFFIFFSYIGLLICTIFMSVTLVLLFIYNLNLNGYKYELIKAISEGKDSSKIALPNSFSSQRIKTGLVFFISNFIYSLPALILYVLTMCLFFIPILVLDSGQMSEAMTDDTAWTTGDTIIFFGIIISFIPAGIAQIYMMIQQFFLQPACYRQFIVNKDISAFFSFKEIFKFIKQNIVNMFLYLGIFWGVIFILNFVNSFLSLTIFICIGIIIYPIFIAVYSAYFHHLQAYMIGEIIRLSK
ncbi:DUF4013 domain-containing protein [Candidatus Dojkabacteria bacterium]|nr:DUF4013 domain-containing protein [Candidatus Dojkabacteria bacterium]